ncbi:MAG: DUF924 family protein [Pseudomonadota bacterium]
MKDSIEEIYQYWFGDILDNPNAEDRSQLWYRGGPEVDNDIRNKFEHLILQAQSRRIDDWANTARGSTALIILLDQFPLNIYRGDPRAFASEQHSVDIALAGIATGQDRELSFHERVFFYLPLEHSESAEHQVLSIQYFTQLRDEAPEHLREAAQGTLQYAIDHKEIVDRFGRYPHRNKALGRVSTPEEIQYLEDGGATYGQ